MGFGEKDQNSYNFKKTKKNFIMGFAPSTATQFERLKGKQKTFFLIFPSRHP